MPRLVNSATGVVVNVSDELAEQLGTDYKPVTGKSAAPRSAQSSKPAEKK